MARSKITIPEAFQILGLPEGASWQEVREAYRKLAKRWHPDISDHPRAKEKFASIARAYDRLEKWENAGRPVGAATDIWDLIARRAAEHAAQRQAKLKRQKIIYRWAKQRREREDREQMRAYRKAIAVMLLLFTAYFASIWGYDQYIDYQISKNPVRTYARVTGQRVRSIEYQFESRGKYYRYEMAVRKALNENRSGNGMPISVGDRFIVRYKLDDPASNYLEFEQPHPTTLLRYLELVQNQLPRMYPEVFLALDESDRENKAWCVTLQVFDRFGFDGLADIYFRDESFLENFSNNGITFSTLESEDDYRECFTNCGLPFGEE